MRQECYTSKHSIFVLCDLQINMVFKVDTLCYSGLMLCFENVCPSAKLNICFLGQCPKTFVIQAQLISLDCILPLYTIYFVNYFQKLFLFLTLFFILNHFYILFHFSEISIHTSLFSLQKIYVYILFNFLTNQYITIRIQNVFSGASFLDEFQNLNQ